MDVLTKASVTEEAGFADIVGLIAAARQRAFQAVNTTLIDLYWQVGEYISARSKPPSGVKAWCRNWLNTLPRRSRGNAVLRAPTCSE